MAEISLQDYLDKLDTLLSEEAYHEVVYHCRHIIQHFPKHIGAYRRLGRALMLESRWVESGEVLQRALSVLPDDVHIHNWLAQVYQRTKQPERVIWHLERVFDHEPNNSSVIENLRELYRMYRNIEPEKLRLTTSAVARQYARNHQFDQSVELLRGALRQAPDRVDLRLLLARTLYRAERDIDAAEVAFEVLRVLPDSLEANRILAEVWVAQGRPSDAQRYISRLETLDPYLALTLARGEEPPRDEIMLPELDYQTVARRDLTSDAPDWLAVVDDMPLDMTQMGATGGESEPITGPLVDPDTRGDTGDLAPEAADDFVLDESWLHADEDAETIQAEARALGGLGSPDDVDFDFESLFGEDAGNDLLLSDFDESPAEAKKDDTLNLPPDWMENDPASDEALSFRVEDEGDEIGSPVLPDMPRRTGRTGMLSSLDDEESSERDAAQPADVDDDALGISEEDALSWLDMSDDAVAELAASTGMTDNEPDGDLPDLFATEDTSAEAVDFELPTLDEEAPTPGDVSVAGGDDDESSAVNLEEADPLAWLRDSGVEVLGEGEESGSVFDPYTETEGEYELQDPEAGGVDPLAWLRDSGVEVLDESDEVPMDSVEDDALPSPLPDAPAARVSEQSTTPDFEPISADGDDGDNVEDGADPLAWLRDSGVDVADTDDLGDDRAVAAGPGQPDEWADDALLDEMLDLERLSEGTTGDTDSDEAVTPLPEQPTTMQEDSMPQMNDQDDFSNWFDDEGGEETGSDDEGRAVEWLSGGEDAVAPEPEDAPAWAASQDDEPTNEDTSASEPEPDTAPDWLSSMAAEDSAAAAAGVNFDLFAGDDDDVGEGDFAELAEPGDDETEDANASGTGMLDWLGRDDVAPVATDNADDFGVMGADFGFGQPEPGPADDMPDWLTELDDDDSMSADTESIRPLAEAGGDTDEDDDAGDLFGFDLDEDEDGDDLIGGEPASVDDDEVPDWLVNAAPVMSAAGDDDADADEDDDAMDDLFGFDDDDEEDEADEEAVAAAEDVPDWLVNAAPVTSAVDGEGSTEDDEAMADLFGFDDDDEEDEADEEAVAAAENVPDWLAGIQTGEDSVEEDEDAYDFETGDADDFAFAASAGAAGSDDAEGDSPDWLTAFDAEEEADEAPAGEDAATLDWDTAVTGAGAAAAAAAGFAMLGDDAEDDDSAMSEDTDALEEDEVPDWLTALDDDEEDDEPLPGTATAFGGEGFTTEADAPTEDDGFDWGDDDELLEEEPLTAEPPLGSLGFDAAPVEGAGLDEEEAIPDWLAAIDTGDETEDTALEPAAVEATEADLNSLDWGLDDDDVGVADGEGGDLAFAFVEDDADDFPSTEEDPEFDVPDWLQGADAEQGLIDDHVAYDPEFDEAEVSEANAFGFDDEEELDQAPADNAPDWLNTMVPGLDIDFGAEEDEPIEQTFVEEALGEDQVLSAEEVDDMETIPIPAGATFDWLTRIVDEELRPPGPMPEAAGARRRFEFSKPPVWLRDNGGAEHAAQNESVRDDADFGQDLPPWLAMDDDDE